MSPDTSRRVFLWLYCPAVHPAPVASWRGQAPDPRLPLPPARDWTRFSCAVCGQRSKTAPKFTRRSSWLVRLRGTNFTPPIRSPIWQSAIPAPPSGFIGVHLRSHRRLRRPVGSEACPPSRPSRAASERPCRDTTNQQRTPGRPLSGLFLGSKLSF
jgi:hypothetical protein